MAKSALFRTLSRLKDGEYVTFSTSELQAIVIVRATKTTPRGVVEAQRAISVRSVADSSAADVIVSADVDMAISDVRAAAALAELDEQEAGDAGTTA
jgi:hypothetical protein